MDIMLPLTFLLPVLLALLTTIPADAASTGLSSFIAKCPTTVQEELNACALQVAREMIPKLAEGIPELDIPPLEPYKVEGMVMESRGAKLTMTNFVIKNLVNTQITNVEINLKDRLVVIDFENPKIESSGFYKLEGDVSGFPVRGSGNSSFVYHNIKAHYWVKLVLKKNPKDGLDYLAVGDSFLTFKPSKVQYWFDNLFGGDRTLGSVANAYLNEHWTEIFAETKETIFEALKEIMRVEIMRVFKGVPYNQIFPE